MITRMYRAAVAALILASVIVVAGCGSSNDATTDTADTTAAAVQPAGGNAALATCLKEHGVELPQGGFGAPGGQPSGGQGTPGQLPAGVDASKFQEAMQACGGRPQGGFPGGGTGSAAFTKCMKDRGIEVGQGQSPGALPEGVSQDEFQAAQQACRDKVGVGATGANGAIGRPASGFARFAACMKKNGVTLPGASGSSASAAVDPSSAAYKKADKACSSLLSDGQAGGTP
jgi:hypothetical protein